MLLEQTKFLELATQEKVRRVIVLSTWHVYGAYSDNPVFIKESNLLRLSIKHPDLRDVVEMDQLTTNWILEVSTRDRHFTL